MNLAEYIDHTYLKPDCSTEQVERLCKEAIEHGFFAICIPPYFVQKATQILKESPVKVATVIGFPYGYSATASKVEEIKRAIDDGADELDVVINIAAVKDTNWNYFRNDIESMTRAVHLRGKVIKTILETNFLSPDEIRFVCEICIASGVNFIKTSTGLHGGATIEMVRFLRSILPNEIKIKASGGISTADFAKDLLDSGASRIGASKGVEIVGFK